jgi:hypothetical protein
MTDDRQLLCTPAESTGLKPIITHAAYIWVFNPRHIAEFLSTIEDYINFLTGLRSGIHLKIQQIS